MSDKSQSTGWQPIETAPKDECIRVRVRGWTEWTHAIFEHGAWRDANYSPIDAIEWSPCAGDDNE